MAYPRQYGFHIQKDFLRAMIAISNGMPYVSWSPDLNTNGEVRVYTVLGKTK